jgi:hypothetical protein
LRRGSTNGEVASLGLGVQGALLCVCGNGCSADQRNQVEEVFVPGRGPIGSAVSFQDGGDLVGERVGLVMRLVKAGNQIGNQWGYVVRGDRQACSVSGIGDRGSCADLKPDPVAEVEACRLPQVTFGLVAVDGPVQVDVDGVSNDDRAGEQRGSSFDDPLVIEGVEAREQPVIPELPLKLGQRPAASGQGPCGWAIRRRRSVNARRKAACDV